MMNNVMVDLETLGTRPGSVILAIGAVKFDVSTGLGEEFYVEISQYASKHAGLTTDQDTVDWWEGQTEAARSLLTRTQSGGLPPHQALLAFNNWLPPDPLVWGNGAAFDNAILAELYVRCAIKPGWEFYNDRCYRTLKSLFQAIPLIRTGTHHNALDDAKSQAEHAIRLLHQVTE